MAQLPEPPTNVPRIVEVQNPATGHYVVMVRMPTNLANKWPDKPWGTSIAEIGLSKKDSDLYPDYTLVDIEPLKGSPDLYWIFQKLGGPVWTTRSQGQDSLIPGKYRRLVTNTRTKQEVARGAALTAITGDLVQSVVEEQDDTGKAVKVDTSETINVNASPLVGERMIEYGIADTKEQIVNEGTAAEAGFLILQSEVDPLGNGKSIASSLRVTDFPVLIGTEILAPYNLPVQVAKQVVPAGTTGSVNGATIVEVRPMDKWRSIQITSTIGIPGNESFPKDVRYKFPDVLEKIRFAILYSGAYTTTSWHGDMLLDILAGPSGSFKGRVERSFHIGPPASTGTLWNPKPKGDSLAYIMYVSVTSTFARRWAGGLNIPATLHAPMGIDVQGAVGGLSGDMAYSLTARFASNFTSTLPGTNYQTLPASGSEIMIDRNSERVRGDVWVMEKTFLTMP
jgi:hypothetical protein